MNALTRFSLLMSLNVSMIHYRTLEAISLLLPCPVCPEPLLLGKVPPAPDSGHPAATNNDTTSCNSNIISLCLVKRPGNPYHCSTAASMGNTRPAFMVLCLDITVALKLET